METEFSFDEMDDFGNEDFGNEDFGIDSEYFENEEYIDETPIINEKPVLKSTTNTLKSATNVLKPIINQKKPNTMSYNDILKSMNVTVVNGKLVLSKGTSNKIEEVKEENTSKKVRGQNDAGKLTAGTTPTYSFLTTDIGTQAKFFNTQNMAYVPQAYFGKNTWRNKFDSQEHKFFEANKIQKSDDQNLPLHYYPNREKVNH